METLMMVVTVVALALAIGMSVVAWRLLRDNRQRSSVRVAALRDMAAETERPARFASLDEIRQEDGTDARDAWDLGLEPRPASRAAALPDAMFGSTTNVRTGAPPRRWLALAVVGLLMAAAASTVYALHRPMMAGESSLTPEPSAPRDGGPRPIELLSLRHGTDTGGAFTVTGLVQNPLTGQAVRKVTAVVYLFDREGTYFASGKAALEFAVLQPGDESPFVVHVPNVSRVSRYRVGFRSEEGGIVAHVDRRGQLPGGTTGDAIDVQRSAAAKRPEGTP